MARNHFNVSYLQPHLVIRRHLLAAAVPRSTVNENENKFHNDSQRAIAKTRQVSLALASMAQDDSPESRTAPASSMAAAIRGKVGSEFEI